MVLIVFILAQNYNAVQYNIPFIVFSTAYNDGMENVFVQCEIHPERNGLWGGEEKFIIRAIHRMQKFSEHEKMASREMSSATFRCWTTSWMIVQPLKWMKFLDKENPLLSIKFH